MIITIFGATGMVGKRLVSLGLNKGHTIRAFGRNVFTSHFMEQENLRLIQGALFDEENVFNAINGCDAVLSSLGGAITGIDKTRSLGMKKIAGQMVNAGVNRIIAVGGMGILDDGNNKLIMDSPDFPQEFLPVAIEHYVVYETLKNSTLNWTVVACPDLIDHEATASYFTAANTLPVPNRYKINTGDLALFMLTELERNQYVKQKVGISN